MHNRGYHRYIFFVDCIIGYAITASNTHIYHVCNVIFYCSGADYILQVAPFCVSNIYIYGTRYCIWTTYTVYVIKAPMILCQKALSFREIAAEFLFAHQLITVMSSK